MRKYEEPHYLYENIRTKIYPWVKTSLIDHMALNGKSISEKDTPLVAFVGDLLVCFAIQREHGQYEILKDNMLPPECDIEGIGKMMIFGQEAYNRNLDKISEGLYLFSKDKEELSVYVSEN